MSTVHFSHLRNDEGNNDGGGPEETHPLTQDGLLAGTMELLGSSSSLPSYYQLAAMMAGLTAGLLTRSNPTGIATTLAALLLGSSVSHAKEITQAAATEKSSYAFKELCANLGFTLLQLGMTHGIGLGSRAIEAKLGKALKDHQTKLLETIFAGTANTVSKRLLFRGMSFTGQYFLPFASNAVPFHVLHSLFYGFFYDDWDPLLTVRGNVTGILGGGLLMSAQRAGIWTLKNLQLRSPARRFFLSKEFASRTPERLAYQTGRDPAFTPFNQLGSTVNWVGGTGLALSGIYSADYALRKLGYQADSGIRQILGVHDLDGLDYYRNELWNLGALRLSARPFDLALQRYSRKNWIDDMNKTQLENLQTFGKNHYSYQHFVHNRVPYKLRGKELRWTTPDDEFDSAPGPRNGEPRSLADRIEFLVKKHAAGTAPDTLEISAYAVPTLSPPKAFLAQVQEVVDTHLKPGQRFVLTLRGDPLDPPQVHVFQKNTSPKQAREDLDLKAALFWQKHMSAVDRELARPERLELCWLRDAMREVYNAHPDKDTQVSLGQAANAVIVAYNRRYQEQYALNPEKIQKLARRFYDEGRGDTEEKLFKTSDPHTDAVINPRLLKRSEVLRMMDRLDRLSKKTLVKTRARAGYNAAYDYANEVSRWRERFLPNPDAPKMIVFGTGDVIPLPAGVITYAKDIGSVSLDVRLVLVSPRSFEVAEQLNRTGHRKDKEVAEPLKQTGHRKDKEVAEPLQQTGHRPDKDKVYKYPPIFPAGSLRPYAIPQVLAAEIIKQHGFDYAFLAAEHEHLLTNVWHYRPIMEALRQRPPRAFVNVSKDLAADGQDPVTATLREMENAGLSESELMVVGGYYSGSEVSHTTNRLPGADNQFPLALAGGSKAVTRNFTEDVFGLRQSGTNGVFTNRILHVEIISDDTSLRRRALATFVSIEGVGKNLVGQYLSRLLMQSMLRFEAASLAHTFYEAFHYLRKEMLLQMTAAVEVTAKQRLRAQDISVPDGVLRTPHAVLVDIERAMPRSAKSLRSIVKRVHNAGRLEGEQGIQDIATLLKDIDSGKYSEIGTRNGRGGIKRAIVEYFISRRKQERGRMSSEETYRLLSQLYGGSNETEITQLMFAQEAGAVSSRSLRGLREDEWCELHPLVRLATESYGAERPLTSIDQPLAWQPVRDLVRRAGDGNHLDTFEQALWEAYGVSQIEWNHPTPILPPKD